MVCVFEARNAVEAHMVLHVLQRLGIEARIDGEMLAGGIGELPVIGLIRVLVQESDRELALQAVRDWEAGKFSIGSSDTADADEADEEPAGKWSPT